MKNDIHAEAGTLGLKLPSNVGTAHRINKNTWKLAFIFAFVSLVIDGVDIMLLSFSLTSLKAEFGLTTFQAGMLGSASLAGMALGGISGGWACDKFGRVKTIAWSVVFFSIMTCILGFTQNYEQFMILRFIGAFGLGSLYMACNTLMAEYVPTKYRTTVLGTLQTGYAADKFGRRITFVFGTVSTAAFLPVIIFFNTPDNIAYLLVTFGFLYGIPYGVNATYMAETFSTDVRGTAIGGAYNMGRLGAAIAPATIGMIAAGSSFTMAFIVMGAAYFIAGVIPGLLIRERQYDPQQASLSAQNTNVETGQTAAASNDVSVKPATVK
ncbi:MFS transporter [Acinetobacter indicus]|uniref:MFS transporter n=1 Tax=Acinetobacter indicus TaxID=756892 RepID=UPI000948A5B4|nr:MFS transporter [Acinetobacter indicus]